MSFPIVLRNPPINTRIKWFRDKRSGHVEEARNEIKHRFAYLDWSQQKKIIRAFLSSNKKDRQWIYSQMFDIWDDSFSPIIKGLWEKYHEQRCAWLVIRFLSKDYVLENIDLFPGGRDYYYVCRRFAGDEDFIIDENRLSPQDLFAAHVIANKPLDGDYCIDTIFECLHNTSTAKYSFSETNSKKRGEVLDAFDFKYVYAMKKNMERMGLDEALRTLIEWNRNVWLDIVRSEDWEQLNSENISDVEYLSRRRYITQKYIYKNLEDKYKFVSLSNPTVFDIGDMPSDFLVYHERGYKKTTADPPLATKEQIQELIELNPAVATLIEKLGIEVDDADDSPF